MPYYAQYNGPEGFGTYEVDWSSGSPVFNRVSRSSDIILVPGFVDLHIHGAFGIDLMSASKADLVVLCDKLAAVGYELFLPTTVTASAKDVKRALANLPDDPRIGGFHLEGPFLSSDYPGAQPADAIVDPPIVDSEWEEVLGDPRLRLITLAPERPHALELTARLAQRGVVVSMGHSNATYDEARFGFEFGASHVTHMFNAMRGFHHREAGLTGYALTQDALSCELIYDRLHVSKEAAQFLLKCKPPDHVVAVSDSTMATGTPPGQHLTMWGLECVTERRSIRLASNNALAGSAITLADAFRSLADDFGIETAIRLCCENPRKVLKMGIKPRIYLELNKKLELVGRRELG